jgi:glucose 1-dehydrogenase
MRLSGKVAIVTGASSGNGRSIAQRFAEEGAHLVLADVDAAGLGETERLVLQHEHEALSIECDVTSRDDTQALIDATVERFGRLDIMVANAGIADGAPFLEMDDDTWNRTLDVNLRGVFLSDQIAARQMVEQGGGAIVNIASIMAELGNPGAANYCASKAGVKSLTKSAALALAPFNIRVNAIGPGFIATAMTADTLGETALEQNLIGQTPMDRIGEAVDVANAAVYLASDEAKFTTGQTIFPDGGYLLNYQKPSEEVIAAGLRVREQRLAD